MVMGRVREVNIWRNQGERSSQQVSLRCGGSVNQISICLVLHGNETFFDNTLGLFAHNLFTLCNL